MSKASVELARRNLGANEASNARVARLTAQEFVEAYAGVRGFERLREAGIVLEGGWKLPLDVRRDGRAPIAPSPTRRRARAADA